MSSVRRVPLVNPEAKRPRLAAWLVRFQTHPRLHTRIRKVQQLWDVMQKTSLAVL
jgi:hypothetical protein